MISINYAMIDDNFDFQHYFSEELIENKGSVDVFELFKFYSEFFFS